MRIFARWHNFFRVQKSRKQWSQEKKRQTVENRKHLEGVRVIRLNLVFIIGLPPRVADPDVLKRYEYCGKFGKIRNITVNSTEYPPPQVGPQELSFDLLQLSDVRAQV